MSRASIAFLVFRLAAVYLWVQALLQTSNAVVMLLRIQAAPREMSIDGWAMSLVSVPVILFVCGSLLFLWAPVLANRMFPAAATESGGGSGSGGLGGLALRMLGILVSIAVIQRLPGAFEQWAMTTGPGTYGIFIADVAGTAVLALFSAWLIVFGPRIARWALRERSSGAPDPKTARFQTIAFSIVGLWLVANSLPNVVESLIDLVTQKLHPSEEQLFGLRSHRSQAQQWVSLVQAVVGVALFFGSHGLSLLWHRVRTAGLRNVQAEPREGTG
jgi:hypothetical protein